MLILTVLMAILIFILSLKRMEYGLFFLIFLIPVFPKVPLFKISNTYIPARLDDILIFMVAFAFLLKFSKKQFDIHNPLNKWLGIFLVIGFISTFFGVIAHNVNPLLGFLHFLKRIEYISMFYITFATLKDETQIRKTIKMIITAYTFVIIYGILQRFELAPIFSSMYRDYMVGHPLYFHDYQRVISTFSGPYDFAAYLIIMFFIILTLLSLAKELKKKVFFGFELVLGLGLLYATYSRTPLGALVIGIFVLILIYRKWKWLLPSLVVLLSPLLIFKNMLIRLTSTGILEIPAGVTYQQAMTGISQGFDMSALVRFADHWPKAFQAFLQHPMLGAGYSSLGEAIDGDYLRMLGETGILGLVFFGIIIYVIMKTEWKTFKASSGFFSSLSIAILVGTIALLLDAIFIDIFEASKIASYFWILTGIAFKMHQLEFQKINQGGS